jgi:hypothetical protein
VARFNVKIEDGRPVCPACGSPLDGTVVVCYHGVPLAHTPDGYGAYLDDAVDADTFDAGSAEYELIRIGCPNCRWTLELGDNLAEAEAQEGQLGIWVEDGHVWMG